MFHSDLWSYVTGFSKPFWYLLTKLPKSKFNEVVCSLTNFEMLQKAPETSLKESLIRLIWYINLLAKYCRVIIFSSILQSKCLVMTIYKLYKITKNLTCPGKILCHNSRYYLSVVWHSSNQDSLSVALWSDLNMPS